MRMAGVVTAGVLILEILVAGAFLLGFFWLEGWQWGLIFSGLMLLLIVLPWAGELKLVFDSDGPRGAVRLGWWGRASFAVGEHATRLVVRVLGIPIRRRIPKKAEAEVEAPSEEAESAVVEEAPTEAPPVKREKPGGPAKMAKLWRRIDSDTIEGFCRAVGSAMGATCELIWGAKEIRVSVQDPVGQDLADTALEQLIGCREVGPLDVTVTRGSGERRVRVIYRIGMLRALLAGVQMAIDGRLPDLLKRIKKRKDDEPATQTVDADQRIIDQIVEQQCASHEEDED